jgi:hypothetical protein
MWPWYAAFALSNPLNFAVDVGLVSWLPELWRLPW